MNQPAAVAPALVCAGKTKQALCTKRTFSEEVCISSKQCLVLIEQICILGNAGQDESLETLMYSCIISSLSLQPMF